MEENYLKKQIGIMSMQRIFNYGSFLQAYSLRNIIKDLGYDVRFVDYHPDKPVIQLKEKKIFRKYGKAMETLKLNAPLEAKFKFIKYKRNYAKNYFPLLNLNSTKNYDTKELDVLVIGSDEVFNCVQSNPNVGFSPDLFGANAESKKLISYAASFGNTTLDKLNNYNLSGKLSKWMKNFNAISVRDSNSANIIRNLTEIEPSINFDPVLIYFDKKVLNSHLNKIEVKNKYLILYGYNGRFSISECKFIRKFANDHDLKILCIGGLQHCCDEFIDCNPFEVLSYFKNAEYIITDTFHGTIMSIINNKKFVTLVRNSGYGNSQKLEDLLDRLDLNAQKLNVLKNLTSYLEKEINYDSVNKKLEEERSKTISYLTRNLA